MGMEPTLSDSGALGDIDEFFITGVPGIEKRALNSAAYVQPVRDGAYSVSMNRETEFIFADVRDNVSRNTILPGKMDLQTAPNIAGKTTWIGPAVLWDNGFDSIIFRIDVPPSVADQSFTLKIWKAWEYQPTFNSLLYNMSHLSPGESCNALALYREIERQLPVAVPARDNPDFWNTVLNLVEEGSDILSIIPGPVGTVAKGVHAISHLLTAPSRRRKKKKTVKSIPSRPKKGARKKKKKRA